MKVVKINDNGYGYPVSGGICSLNEKTSPIRLFLQADRIRFCVRPVESKRSDRPLELKMAKMRELRLLQVPSVLRTRRSRNRIELPSCPAFRGKPAFLPYPMQNPRVGIDEFIGKFEKRGHCTTKVLVSPLLSRY